MIEQPDKDKPRDAWSDPRLCNKTFGYGDVHCARILGHDGEHSLENALDLCGYQMWQGVHCNQPVGHTDVHRHTCGPFYMTAAPTGAEFLDLKPGHEPRELPQEISQTVPFGYKWYGKVGDRQIPFPENQSQQRVQVYPGGMKPEHAPVYTAVQSLINSHRDLLMIVKYFRQYVDPATFNKEFVDKTITRAENVTK